MDTITGSTVEAVAAKVPTSMNSNVKALPVLGSKV